MKKKFLIILVIVVELVVGCDKNVDEPEIESLLTINNATDVELINNPNKFVRKSTGSGIIGTWTQVYESTTGGNVTGRRNTEWTFKDTNSFSGYTSRWSYGESSGWQAIGLPYTESGNFSIETVNEKKVITIMIYNFDNKTYIAKYRNANVYVSENYLLIDNLTSNSNNNFNASNGTITNYTGQGGDIIIPSTIDGIIITTIGDGAFSNKSLTSVVIPDSVTTIKDWAFHDNQLTSVTIPNNITFIGNQAFQKNKLTSVNIPNNVTHIGIEAFNLNELTSVTIPDSITLIASGVFANNRLTSVSIPYSVTSIMNSAFNYNQLISITIGANVTLYTETLTNYASFGYGFENTYNNSGKLAGMYTRINTTSTTWIRQ